MTTTDSDTATVEQFRNDVAANFMGDRTRMKALGPFVVELYERAGLHRQRMRDGEPEVGCVSVWQRDPRHSNGWSPWGDRTMIPVTEAREVFESLTDADAVREWCNDHPHDRRPSDD